ncbi:MAG TPA: hypothetical protein VKA10_06270 [Prolixibacteraceae bacterium]|nr:hypothetical protein [Prolixibacteraceae bacterium]
MRSFLLLIIFLGWIGEVGAQYFQTGEDPASIKWRQLNSDNFQLIYPDYYEKKAQNLANVLEEVYRFGGHTLDYQPEKISVILHTQTIQSNGLVGWAPKRSEFYTTPHQEIYPQDWLQQLAIHEFRHVVQIDKINANLPGIVRTILGEQGTALFFGLHISWWFIEGDAVVAETALSNYGRGRLPSFLMEHQAQVVEKGIYSYDKAYFGSYRDFVPNRYKLGYYMVGGARIKYGPELWNKALNRVGDYPFTLSPLSRVLKNEIGLNKSGLYYSVFDSLQQVWLQEDENYIPSNISIVTQKAKVYTNYIHNHLLNDSTVLTYKTSFDQIPTFVKIDANGNETPVFRPGTVFRESVGYRDHFIIWSEQIPDHRWTHSGTSLIRILNTQNNDLFEIKTKFKSFNPAISPDKTKFAVVEADFSNNYFISVYQIPDGKLITRFQSDENNYFFSPRWINNEELVVIILTDKGKRLARINPELNKLNILFDVDMGEINDLKIQGNFLYFISSYTGKNSLYRMNLTNNNVFHLYEPRFGVESPAIDSDNQKIILSDYTANGFRLVEIPLTEIDLKEWSEVEKGTYRMAEILASQEAGIPDFTTMDTTRFPTKKYNKPTSLFNFHSWAPVFINADSYEFWPGVSVMSQNMLGTAETILGYRYYLSENTGQFYAGYKFKGWYPVFDAEINIGNRASEVRFINQIQNPHGEIINQDTTFKRVVWGETAASLDVLLPLNFNKGPFNRRLQPQVGYDFTAINYRDKSLHNFEDVTYHSAIYRLYYHQLLRRSYRSIYPNFGFVLDFAYRNSPFGTTRFGNLTTYQSILYAPGALPNHGFKIYGGYQKKKMEGTRGFTDALRYPRGWGKLSTTEMFSSAVDYVMPLLYPDWNIARFLNFKRATMVLFADFANLKGNLYEQNHLAGTYNKNIVSFGTELNFDVHALRIAPVNIGVRASYLPELEKVHYDFLFSINLDSL